MNVELSYEEAKTIVELLKFSLDSCPIESISHEVDITSDKVQDLITKLEKTLQKMGEKA